MDTLENLLSNIYSECEVLRELQPPSPSIRLLVLRVGSESVLVFVRRIEIGLGAYNTGISKDTLGPELIHRTDLICILKTLRQSNVKKCMYVIHSLEDQAFTVGYDILYDERLLQWWEETE